MARVLHRRDDLEAVVGIEEVVCAAARSITDTETPSKTGFALNFLLAGETRHSDPD